MHFLHFGISPSITKLFNPLSITVNTELIVKNSVKSCPSFRVFTAVATRAHFWRIFPYSETWTPVYQGITSHLDSLNKIHNNWIKKGLVQDGWTDKKLRKIITDWLIE